MKPNSGSSGGRGFIKLEFAGGIKENNKPIGMTRFHELKASMRNYVITEYVRQRHELVEIWLDSECTLRVILRKDRPKDVAPTTWSCAAPFAIFGTSISVSVSNIEQGGAAVGFDFENGKYNDICMLERRFASDGRDMLEKHPDTNAVWKEQGLPNWAYTRGKIFQICRHPSSLDYLDLDIIITEDGSHPAMDLGQVLCSPGLSRKKCVNFLRRKACSHLTAGCSTRHICRVRSNGIGLIG